MTNGTLINRAKALARVSRRISLINWCVFCLLSLAVFPSLGVLSAADELRLVCEKGARALPLAKVEANQLLVRDGDHLLTAPAGGTWRLEGDLIENAALVRWFPPHSIQRPIDYLNAASKKLYATAKLHIEAIPLEPDRVNKQAALQIAGWSTDLPDNLAIISLWIENGHVTKVIPRAITRLGPDTAFSRSFSFNLSQNEFSGQPAVLLWSNGAFVAPTPEFKDPPTNRAFIAALMDNVLALEQAIAAGAKLGQMSPRGTLAHFAAGAGAVHTLELLLKLKPSLRDKVAAAYGTPLDWASLAGRTGIVRTLIAAKVNVARSFDAIKRAVSNGHTDVVRLLANAGAPNQSSYGLNLLQVTTSSGQTEIAELLLKLGGKYDFSRPGSEWALVNHARSGNAPMVKFLLTRGVTPNAVAFFMETKDTPRPGQEKGITALIAAAEGNSEATATLLLEHGADVNRQTVLGVTALQIAAGANRPTLVRLLLAHGADLQIRNRRGLSALDIALLECAPEAIIELTRAGASVDLHSDRAPLLLEQAIRLDRPEVIKRALDAGWSPNARLVGGASALRLARYFEASSCETILCDAGADGQGDFSFPIAKASELDAPVKLRSGEMPEDARPAYSRTPQTVEVDMLVDPTGHPFVPRVLDPADRQLAAAALRAVPGWQFLPPRRKGAPVAARVVLPIVFAGSATQEPQDYEGIAIRAPKVSKWATPYFPAVISHRNFSSDIQSQSSADINGNVSVLMARYPSPQLVIVSFVVDTSGSVTDTAVLRSDDPVFSGPALRALEKFRFTPAIFGGRAVSTRMEMVFEFTPPCYARALAPTVAISLEPAQGKHEATPTGHE
ncbi:MAG: TonB family protein [Opitutaceae bacterium]|nr:TonB family protein [Opitutaceae bacterium]